jgi:small subunit ribosomal protein S6
VRRYELMLLFQPDLEDDQLQAAVERVTRAIVNAGGSLSKISPWGKRRLAYPIQHHRDASYFLIHFDIEPSAVRDIERGLLISEEILRHLVVVLAPRQRRAADETAEDVTGEADVALAPPPPIDEDVNLRPRAAADQGEADEALSSADDATVDTRSDDTGPDDSETDDAGSDGADDEEHTADLKTAEEVAG